MLGMSEAMNLLNVKRHVFYNIVNDYRLRYKDRRDHKNTGKAKKDSKVYNMLVSTDVEDIESYIERYLDNTIDLADACFYLDIAPEQFKKIRSCIKSGTKMIEEMTYMKRSSLILEKQEALDDKLYGMKK